MELDDFTSSAATLAATVVDLRRRVEALERAKPVPGVVPLRLFPSWYQAATASPEPPVTEDQLRRWVSRPKHFDVDWVVRRGRSVSVDTEKFVAWVRRPTPARPKKEVRS